MVSLVHQRKLLIAKFLFIDQDNGVVELGVNIERIYSFEPSDHVLAIKYTFERLFPNEKSLQLQIWICFVNVEGFVGEAEERLQNLWIVAGP